MPANKLSVLVVRERWRRAILAHPVSSDRHGFKCLVGDLRETGYQRLVHKSDQEPAIRMLCGAAKGEFECEAIAPKESPEKSNGEAEDTVKHIRGLVRTVRAAFQVPSPLRGPMKIALAAILVNASDLPAEDVGNQTAKCAKG